MAYGMCARMWMNWEQTRRVWQMRVQVGQSIVISEGLCNFLSFRIVPVILSFCQSASPPVCQSVTLSSNMRNYFHINQIKVAHKKSKRREKNDIK